MRLKYLAVLLAVVSVAAAVGAAATGDLRLPPATDAQPGDAAADPALVSAEISLARDAENAGNVEAALAHYRSAALIDPRIVDPRSPFFLGPAFEARLNRWIAELKKEGAGEAQARSDAAFLFRRMYGGCG